MQKDFFIEKKWISKNAWGLSVLGLFGFIIICLIIYFSLLRGKLQGSNELYLLWLVLGLYLVSFIVDALAKLRISSLRQSHFQFSILEDGILIKQVVLLVDTNKSFLSMRNPVLGLLTSATLLLSHGIKIEKEYVTKIPFDDVGYVSIMRGPINRIFGLYKIIIALKSIQYSKFHPPSTMDYTGDVVGNSSPEGTFNNFQYRGASIIVIPGLTKENAQEILQLLQSKTPSIELQREIPPTLTFWNIIKGVVYGILLFFIYAILMAMLR